MTCTICGQPIRQRLLPHMVRYCSPVCSRLARQQRQQRQRGPGRPKGSRNEPYDISDAEIDRRFLMAKARLSYQQRKEQSVALGG
jgi:hypothetical protein